MDRNHKISVIIPAYNVAQWLPRCVESVRNQTYQNLEIILIDDGSTDGTNAIVDVFAEKDPRIVAIHQSNAGLVAVREKGISLANGEYVSFVDGDDVIEPEFLEKLLANAVKYDADISHCGMKYCFYDGRVKLHYGTGELIEYDQETGLVELLRGIKIEPSLCNKLYRSKLLTDSCLDPSVMNNEDLLRNFVLFSRANKSVFEDFCGYQYWRRADSMSNNGFHAGKCRDVLKARSLILVHSDESVRPAARQSYINALISCYNATIGNAAEDARQLAAHCKEELLRLKADTLALPSRLRLRGMAILYASSLYRILYRVHEANTKRKIKAAAAKTQAARRKYGKSCSEAN